MEIMFLYLLCTDIGRVVRRNGLKPLRFQALLIILWMTGEALGAVVGAMTLGLGILTYFIALGGAVLGAIIAFRIGTAAQPMTSRFPVAVAQSLPTGQDPITF